MSETVTDKWQRYRKTRARLSGSTKAAVFSALEAANITAVFVDFDGEGDSGQIDNVSARRGEQPVELPQVTLSIRQVSWGESKPHTVKCALAEAIETLCYDYLAIDHDGWENNDGAYGEFRFDVAHRTVTLHINERYTDTHTSTHTF